MEMGMEDVKSKYAKLSVCNLGAAMAVVCGLGMFLLALGSMWFNAGTAIVDILGTLYVGYDSSFGGAIIGLFWGALKGFIGGILLAVIYNWCRCCCRCSYCKDGRCCSTDKACKS